ncbi:MAG: hypothetical protein DWQ10_17790 [Calditrichaeota bacterium]|nr:MAG: hypothetical protein DWQ10_17790 [Calditrichota bacterium]
MNIEFNTIAELIREHNILSTIAIFLTIQFFDYSMELVFQRNFKKTFAKIFFSSITLKFALSCSFTLSISYSVEIKNIVVNYFENKQDKLIVDVPKDFDESEKNIFIYDAYYDHNKYIIGNLRPSKLAEFDKIIAYEKERRIQKIDKNTLKWLTCDDKELLAVYKRWQYIKNLYGFYTTVYPDERDKYKYLIENCIN